MGPFSKQVFLDLFAYFSTGGIVKFKWALFFYYLFMKLFNPFINSDAMLRNLPDKPRHSPLRQAELWLRTLPVGCQGT